MNRTCLERPNGLQPQPTGLTGGVGNGTTRLVLLRHGQSVWNQENRFTGWTDIDLSARGLMEAERAGDLLSDAGLLFDVVATSVLKRAIRTTWIVLDRLNLLWLPVTRTWRLNERHYGALQGLNKDETRKRYGEHQVEVWRRSFDEAPPALVLPDPRFPRLEPQYAGLSDHQLPRTESLRNAADRVMIFWYQMILPALTERRRVLIVAHGNSLRALVKHLEHLSDEQIALVEIPTGVPLVYDLDNHLRVTASYRLTPERVVTGKTDTEQQITLALKQG